MSQLTLKTNLIFKNRVLALLVLALTISAVSCQSFVPNYESVTSGPRAKVIFSSPEFRGRTLRATTVHLYLYDVGENCTFSTNGRVILSSENNEKVIFIPADRRRYFRVEYYQRGVLSGKRNRRQKEFSFVPQENYEYTIEHIDKPGKIKVNFYEFDGKASKQPLKVQDSSYKERNLRDCRRAKLETLSDIEAPKNLATG